MKLLFVITRADAVGGASIHIRDMASRLQAEGHQTLVAIGGTGPVTEALTEAGVAFVVCSGLCRAIRPWQDLRAVIQLGWVVFKFNPDLISTHTSKAGAVGRLVGSLTKTKVIYTPHCWSFVDGFPRAKWYLAAEKLLAPLSDVIVCVSRDERDEGNSRMVGRRFQFLVIHNGMMEASDSSIAEPGKSPVRLVMVGRFEEQKDHETLIRALAFLTEWNWKLELVGDGPHLSRIRKLVVELGLDGRVEFSGYSKRVADCLGRSQVFLLITNWEGFPRSTLEALRAGLPVIATDVGGTREAVLDGWNGFLIPRGDQGTLRKALLRLFNEPALREDMGSRSLESFNRSFTFDHMFSKYRQLYDSLIQSGGTD